MRALSRSTTRSLAAILLLWNSWTPPTRFASLRKRYKDPLTKDGKWKLLNYGDIATLLNAAAPGTPAAALASQNGLSPGGGLTTGASASGSPFSSSLQQQQQQAQQSNSFASGSSASSSQGNQDPNIIYSPGTGPNNQGAGTQASSADSGQGASGGQQSNSPFGQSGTPGGNRPGSNNPASNSPFAQNTTGGGQTFGGGAIVGVASLSKDPTIRIYNKKKTYNEWQFIYNPIMDQANVLLRGPYQPITIGGAQIGTPAGQINGQQQQGAFGQQQNGFGQQQNNFGQQQNGFGQQQSGFGQQPNAPQQPGGGNFPPTAESATVRKLSAVSYQFSQLVPSPTSIEWRTAFAASAQTGTIH